MCVLQEKLRSADLLEALDISVVIPVYNAVKYLRETVESVVENVCVKEIVAVDDCSEDGSFELLCELCNEFPTLKAYKTDRNRGAGYARNTGLGKASGKYIAFLDADDLICKGALDKALASAKGCPDVVYSRTYVCFGKSGRRENTYIPYPYPSFQSDAERRRFLLQKQPAMWCCLYSREFIDRCGLFFPDDLRMCEDNFWSFTVALQVQTYAEYPAPIIMHRITENSLSQSRNDMSHFDTMSVAERGWEYVRKRGWYWDMKDETDLWYFYSCCVHSLGEIKHKFDTVPDKIVLEIRKRIKQRIPRIMKNKYMLQHEKGERREYGMLIRFPRLYCLLLKARKKNAKVL